MGQNATDLDQLARRAEAEATAAELEAAAATSRVHELRRSRNRGEYANVTDEGSPTARTSRWRRPRRTTILTGIGVIATCGLLATGGYLRWHHQQIDHEQQRRAEFVAGARQAVISLMSIDGSKAREDVQRIIDNSTGQFRDDFKSTADEFVGVAKESQAVTKASVQAAAVESMTEDSAVVLVTAATTITNSTGPDQQPRTWRLSVDVVREGGQIKMSKVDFVP